MKNGTTNKSLKAFHLKGSSLTNAIFICIVVSVFTGALVLVSYYQYHINDRLYHYEDTISRNASAFNYFLNNSEKVPYDTVEAFDVFNDGILSYLQRKHWGFYDILISKTPCDNDTISKTALVGKTRTGSKGLALYLTDYDRPLKLSGDTKIMGEIQIPNGKVDQAYINGNKGNNIRLSGGKKNSANRLPKITKEPVFDYSNIKTTSIGQYEKNPTIINGFEQSTKVIDLNGVYNLKDITLKGNIALVSNDSLHIDHTARLEDVLIMAPKVRVSNGFMGSVQIVARETVDIDENVLLLYPSSIYVNSTDDRPIAITVNKNSKIIGGIVINGKLRQKSANRELNLEENTLVVGTIYCHGSTQLKGSVIGCVYTDKLHLKTKSSNYENIILNATINKDSLPKQFVDVPLFNSITKQDRYAIIKEF